MKITTNYVHSLASEIRLNIAAFYLKAVKTHERFERWYQTANYIAEYLASENNVSVDVVAQIIAVLSPMSHWERNLYNASMVVSGRFDEVRGTFAANKVKAIAILNGAHIEDVTKSGSKVVAFYNNIMLNPNYVTLDSHQSKISVFGRQLLQKEHVVNLESARKYISSDAKYSIVANAHLDVAKKYGTIGYAIQSITWAFFRDYYTKRQVNIQAYHCKAIDLYRQLENEG